MDMLIIRKRLNDDHAQPQIVTIDEAVLRLQAYSSLATRSRAAIIAELEAGNLLCTNFYSFQRKDINHKVESCGGRHLCAQSSLMVERYLLNEFSQAARISFEAHLVHCQICAEGVRLGKAFIQGIKDGGAE